MGHPKSTLALAASLMGGAASASAGWGELSDLFAALRQFATAA